MLGLGRLLGGIVTLNRQSQLGSGGNPTVIGSQEPVGIHQAMHLPIQVNAQGVIGASYEAGEKSAQALLLSKYSKHKLNTAQALLDAYKVRADHSKQMMNIENQLQSIDASHAKAVNRFQLKTGETAAGLTGYQEAMRRADEVIKF